MSTQTIQVLDKTFKPYISQDELEKITQRIAHQINKDYAGKNPLFISILNGAFMFTSDLVKHIDIECNISFIKLISYKGTTSSGNVITALGLEESITDRHIIVIDDILDTGNTLYHFINGDLLLRKPLSIKTAVLLDKPAARKYNIQADYAGLAIENKFVVGYGLDYNQAGRHLSSLYQIC